MAKAVDNHFASTVMIVQTIFSTPLFIAFFDSEKTDKNLDIGSNDVLGGSSNSLGGFTSAAK